MVDQFVADRLNGLAWIPSTFGEDGRRTNENWQRAELIAVDYDNNVSVTDCLNVPFIRQYALLVHPSASSSPVCYKTRIIFRLDQPITGNLENYRLAVKALGRLLGLPEDACSYKPAQLFYGSTNRIETPHINLTSRLPMVILNVEVERLKTEIEAKRVEAERQRAAMRYQSVDRNSDRARRKIDRTLERAYQKVVSAASDRTTCAHGQARHLAKYLAYWPISENDIERTLIDALTANGAYAKYGSDCLRHIHNGIKAGLKDVAEPLELPALLSRRPYQPNLRTRCNRLRKRQQRLHRIAARKCQKQARR